ncbi:MAG: hypothetical protein SOZ80_03110 [Prevotella sp.]|uniref:hypothetical protein n=1 Tax=Prevotella sp. TaxID=59823 RepID=UPI002A2D9F76|nr:hypothetical protein [Prevotella sp.]MDD7317151.1 hypothetical protein [Prevotellaceae bacterium]MDY4019755.1 hypothetical protein [Prevotella sp.]
MKKVLLLLLTIVSLVSCSEKEPISGTDEVNYYISSYFIPQRIAFTTTVSRNGSFYLLLNTDNHRISQKENPAEFKKLAKEYGETGEKIFRLWHPPVSQPYNILKIKVYKKQNGKMTDVSEQSGIGYSDYSKFVLSKYSGEDFIPTSKKISELTAHDLKWLPERFSISPPTEKEGEYYLVITLESGKELSVHLKEKP